MSYADKGSQPQTGIDVQLSDISEFHSRLKKLNISIPNPIFDGAVHRFDGEKPLSGWYVGKTVQGTKGTNFVIATVGDWVTNSKFIFRSSQNMSAQDREVVKDHLKEAIQKAQEEKKKRQRDVAKKAESMWDDASTATTHPYLDLKKIDSSGARIIGNSLIIRCQDIDGKTIGLQFIDPNGRKRFLKGQKVGGAFFIIGDLNTKETVYFCEGFATGASVHKALGSPVVCCFNASNLPTVAKHFYQKYPGLNGVVCGDDDALSEKNVGRSYAEKAAAIFLNDPVFPSFPSEAKASSDFNDLQRVSGIEEVRDQIEAIQSVRGYTALGMEGSAHCYLVRCTNTILKTSVFTPEKAFMLMPQEHLQEIFPNHKGGIAWLAVKNHLVQESMAVGVFNSDRVRGVGVWLDQGRTVVNDGRCLVVESKKIGLSDLKSRYVYVSSQNTFTPVTTPLTTNECKKLLEALALFRWTRKADSLLLSGWIAISRIAGSLTHRPHIWVTGAKGTGKSTLIQDLIFPALGGSAFEALGGTTAAGIRHAIGPDSLPVVYDEFETDEEAKNNKNLMDLFRQAWSYSDGKIFKGTPEGVAISYSPLFPVLLGGIRTHFFNDANRSRFSVLELQPHKNDQDQKRKMDLAITEIDKDYGARLFSRSVKMIDIIRSNSLVFARAIAANKAQRFANQVGPLLAGYHSLISDREVSLKEAYELVQTLDLDEEAEDSDAADHDDCLNYLLTTKIQYRLDSAVIEENTVGFLVQSKSDAHHKALRKYGVSVKDDRFAVVYKHAELSAIFSSTRWKTWAPSLQRVEGASKGTTRIEGRVTKCVWLPRTEISRDDDEPKGAIRAPLMPLTDADDPCESAAETTAPAIDPEYRDCWSDSANRAFAYNYTFLGKTYPSKLWDGEDLGSIYSYDIETDVVEEGAPRNLVLASACDGKSVYFLKPTDIKRFVETQTGQIIAHNSCFDLFHTAEHTGEQKWLFEAAERTRDTFLLSRLYKLGAVGISHPGGHSLGSLTKQYLNVDLPKEATIGGKVVRLSYGNFLGEALDGIPAGYLHYSAFDSIATFALHAILTNKVRSVSPVPDAEQSHGAQVKALLAAYIISQNGVRLDRNLVAAYDSEWTKRVNTLEAKLVTAGYIPGAKGNQQTLYKILENVEKNCNLKLPRSNHKVQGEVYSTQSDKLKEFANVPFISDYLAYKRDKKISSDFLRRLRDKDSVHTRYTTLLKTGRWSSSPNMQNIPRPNEDIDLRRVFVARPGHQLISADYSGAELVTLAVTLKKLFGQSQLAESLKKGEDLHSKVAAQFFGVKPESITKDQRMLGKIANFGFGGGLSEASCVVHCKEKFGIEISLDEVTRLKKAWMDAFPELYKFFALAEKQFEHLVIEPHPSGSMPKGAAFHVMRSILSGRTETKGTGRKFTSDEVVWAWKNAAVLFSKYQSLWIFKCNIEEKKTDPKFGIALNNLLVNDLPITHRRRAGCSKNSFLNTFFQGLCADIINEAAYELIKAGHRVVMSIHDELVIEAPSEKVDLIKQQIESQMVSTAKKYCDDVPMKVELKSGDNWTK